MSRCIVIYHDGGACGWTVTENGKTSGVLGTDEATAHVAALMLRGWEGFPMVDVSEAARALFREQMRERAEARSSVSHEVPV